MIQATGSNTVQSSSALRGAGENPNPETLSKARQIPEASVVSPGTGMEGAGRGSKHDPALGGADSDDEGEGANPGHERGGDTLSSAARAGQVEAKQAGMGRGRGGECLQGATPMRRTSRSLTPPTSSSLAFDSPARGNSNTAAFLRMGAHPKLSQILRMYPELENLLKTPSPQKPAVNVSSSPRSGAVGPEGINHTKRGIFRQ
ncbi:hypothetical protein DUI87_15386 [Hirundo rustica rustica]|uniref:Uncharacterized protein n=1 Tax=Hirundo rustica rustica TaxID=333673 RepID=A0A3M0K3R7_HIRRU|nr:hypothetical protein DUI87_15386 [Hirundo rustica rustica]